MGNILCKNKGTAFANTSNTATVVNVLTRIETAKATYNVAKVAYDVANSAYKAIQKDSHYYSTTYWNIPVEYRDDRCYYNYLIRLEIVCNNFELAEQNLKIAEEAIGIFSV